MKNIFTASGKATVPKVETVVEETKADTPAGREVVLAYLHSGINIPTFGLSVATTLGDVKTRKGIVMFEDPAGLLLTDGKQSWIVPAANIKAYRLG
jgi:hypothetical protein